LTTIVSVRRHGKVVMGGDGQNFSWQHRDEGNAKRSVVFTTVKSSPVSPVPRTADAFTLFERFEASWKKTPGPLIHAPPSGWPREWRYRPFLVA
jgi:ATP-dependent HslUV protease subunit HslV